MNDSINIGARAEYIKSSGGTNSTGQNLLGYGANSKAWSLTVTPTYQVKNYFVRGEFSYVKVDGLSSGLGFGSSRNDDTQATAMLETGFLF